MTDRPPARAGLVGRLRVLGKLGRNAAKEFLEDKATRLAAALAYYTILSLAPLLVIAVAIAGAAFGERAAEGEIVGQVSDTVGENTAELIQEMLANAGQGSGGVVASVIGFGLLFFGASGVFAQLQGALNVVWRAPQKLTKGIVAAVRKRVFGFVAVVTLGLAFAVVLGVGAVLEFMDQILPERLSALAEVLRFVAPFVTAALAVGILVLVFRYMTVVRVPWKAAAWGSLFTAVLMGIGTEALSIYVRSGSLGSAFGVAGSLIILLVFIFYEAQMFLFGAEFTKVYDDYLDAKAAGVADPAEPRPERQAFAEVRAAGSATAQEAEVPADRPVDRRETAAAAQSTPQTAVSAFLAGLVIGWWRRR